MVAEQAIIYSILAHPIGCFAFYNRVGKSIDPFLAECGIAEAGVDVLLREDHEGGLLVGGGAYGGARTGVILCEAAVSAHDVILVQQVRYFRWNAFGRQLREAVGQRFLKLEVSVLQWPQHQGVSQNVLDPQAPFAVGVLRKWYCLQVVYLAGPEFVKALLERSCVFYRFLPHLVRMRLHKSDDILHVADQPAVTGFVYQVRELCVVNRIVRLIPRIGLIRGLFLRLRPSGADAAPGQKRPAGVVDPVIAIAAVFKEETTGENRQDSLKSVKPQKHWEREASHVGRIVLPVSLVRREGRISPEFFNLV